MLINNTPADYKNIADNQKKISSKGGREILRTFSNPDSLAATIALESSVTGGRGINAYKRGGFYEFRERFTDDVVSAVFWMKGVDIFNKIGDKFGEKVLKLPTTSFDVGKDALRQPFKNLIADYGTDIEKKFAVFKFTKIILSSLLATGFVGFALPKINQSITKHLMAKNDSKNETKNNQVKQTISSELDEMSSFENFEKNINTNTSDPSFKGGAANIMTTVAHCLENNKICKMLTCDVGILTGRVKTARNADEGREYFFRDATSSFFYLASTPLVYKLMQTLTKSSPYTTIDSVAAKQLSDLMTEQLKTGDGSFISMPAKEFAAKVFGSLDDKAKNLLSGIPFSKNVISLEKLKEYITDENLLKKAVEMAKLQPEQAGVGAVLTKQQVADVLRDGAVNTPEFMQKIFKERFGNNLNDKYRFIPMKKITDFRSNISKYGQSVVDYAREHNNGIVDKNVIDKMSKKSFAMSSVFRVIAIGVSAIALGVVIPKLQYAMTQKRTGSVTPPGLREYDEKSKENNLSSVLR